MCKTGGKKILMLLENNPYPHDGRVRREAQTLLAAGYSVAVISPGKKNQQWKENVEGVHSFRYPEPAQANSFLGYLWEYGYSITATFFLSLYVLFRKGFDVIHAHNPPDIFVLIAAFYRLFGKKFVFDHHDLSPEMYFARFSGEGNKIVYKVLLTFEKLTFHFADRVISTNESYKEIAVTRGKVPEEKVSIVRNGPELKRLKNAEPFQELKEKYSTIFGFVGDIGYHDGVDNLIRALYSLVHDCKRTDFYCIIIGVGDAWKDVKKLTTELGLDQYVLFTGFIPDAEMMHYLSTADICVDPDPQNAFTDRSTMIKMTEYMALQKPIVAFGLKEHKFTARDAAIYAKPNDSADFARCLVKLMDNPLLREEMGKAGRLRIETELAWHFQEEYLKNAYKALFRDKI